METPKHQSDETEELSGGPGHLLRQARKAASLDQTDVAKHLNLELRFVDGLERNDYENMPPATFIRGYLVAYAKLVEVDAVKVIELFDVDTTRVDTLKTKSMPPRQASMGDPSMRGITYGLVILLGILLLIWWQGELGTMTGVSDSSDEEAVSEETNIQGQAPGSTNSGSVALPRLTVAKPAAQAPVQEEGASTNSQQASTSESGSNTGADSATTANAGLNAEERLMEAPASDADNDATAETVAKKPDEDALAAAIALSLQANGASTRKESTTVSTAGSVADSEQGSTTQAATVVNDQISDSVTSTASPNPTPVQGSDEQANASASDASEDGSALQVGTEGKDRLGLTADADCWVSVSDAQERRLLYRVIAGGSTINVKGDAPFRVTLGNAEAVDVSINGKSFDHQGFHRGNIARFSVPVSQ